MSLLNQLVLNHLNGLLGAIPGPLFVCGLMSLPNGTMGWSVICNCVSWPFSLDV